MRSGKAVGRKRRQTFADESVRYGDTDDFGVLLKRYGYRQSFPGEVEQAAKHQKALADKEARKAKVFSGRRDCTRDLVVTIDGESAKDFDDAICVRKSKNGFELDVHVADVSHYVLRGDCIDREAQRRGTSVYLLNHVVAMLPFALSNDLCSLLEGKRRLTLACFMKVSFKGDLTDYRFQSAVIESKRRLTYAEVEGILEGKKSLEPKSLAASLNAMKELQNLLFERRVLEGSLHVDAREMEFSMAEDGGRVLDVRLKPRLGSEGIVEEFMLLANRAAADFLQRRGACLYRIHESPDPEKMESFIRLLREKGYRLPKGGSPNPLKVVGKNRFQMAIDSVPKQSPDRDHLSQELLRSMQQARYDRANAGHYGLAFKKYCHFTSPIRRYPDLVVHRLVKRALGESVADVPQKILDQLGTECSFKERKAEEAEREFKKVKTMRYVESRRDEDFHAVITDVEPFGLFVREIATGIRGLVPSRSLPEGVDYNPKVRGFVWQGRKKSLAYRLGQEVKVRLDCVNRRKFFIDFKLAP